MPLTTGTRLGPYEIIAPIGAGGMGEVYRAKGTKLNRDVALSSQSGTQTAWVVDLAGGQPRQFSTMSISASPDLEVSPDGRQVMFLSGGSAVVMPIAGGEPIRRIAMPNTRLRWAPDGRGLTYADAAGTNLWVQPIDGGAPRQLTTLADNKRIVNFAWSPDGKQLAITRAVTTSDIVLLKGVR